MALPDCAKERVGHLTQLEKGTQDFRTSEQTPCGHVVGSRGREKRGGHSTFNHESRTPRLFPLFSLRSSNFASRSWFVSDSGEPLLRNVNLCVGRNHDGILCEFGNHCLHLAKKGSVPAALDSQDLVGRQFNEFVLCGGVVRRLHARFPLLIALLYLKPLASAALAAPEVVMVR
jgi:hypothetical protein